MPSLRTIRVKVNILNLDGDTLSEVGRRVTDGQVNVATDAEGPTRSMSISLYDPENTLRLDSDSPAEGALFADRMMRVSYGVEVAGLGWVDVPVFTGPIVKVDRDDAIVNVECQGKEAFALDPVWRVLTVEKGVAKTDAIKRILRERAGETDFDIPDLPVRLGNPATLTPQPPQPRTVGKGKKAHDVAYHGFNSNTPWGLARDIAHSMSCQLFYDGHGRCRLRKLPGSALYEFDESLVLTAPQVSFDLTEMRNAVKVTGKTLHEGKEKKTQIATHTVSGEAVAPPTHPLSPHRLGRTVAGAVVPRYIPEFITNDAIRSDQEATRRARQVLDDLLSQQVEISFDALPVPHLEEMDLIRVKYEDLRFTARLRRFSLPLTHDGVMSVGYVKRVTRPVRVANRG